MESKNAAHPAFAYVGCFTTEKRKARGKGIAVYRIDQSTGTWTLVEAYDAIPNPHFLTLDHTQKFLYSAHGDSSEIGAYAIDKQTGKLTLLNKQPTGGDNSSHLVPDSSNRYIVLANGPGVAVFPINKDGSLAPFSDKAIPPGEPGPYRREQQGPHPHQAPFDLTGRFVVVPDKGLDKVHVYRFDASSGKLVAGDPPFVKSRYGAAPRHVSFHPRKPYAYVVNELDSTVTAYHWNSERGELKPFQIIPTTPTTYTGDNTGAEIAVAPAGNFVYASNRGHDSIVIFSVNQASGMLDHIGWESVQGKKPRFFGLDPGGSHLYAANENSHTIVAFRVNRETGKLTPTGQIVETGSPSCIVFATQ
ncbi:MAG: 6-phosphogluconolactonase [Betaproteobacteria bacterium RIFCSPLOWO2_12_FULL_62_58]|nr:MAG: 6-phosphogluconolactonase [Betaproteobacteria bacterium RIFCSPLOWO2_12_FULL_62_58]